MERRLQLQPRLQLLADMVPEGCRLADVGTDHGYLPVYLLQRRRIRGAVAADIGAEPLAHARRTAEAYGVEGIDFRLCDGLRDIAPDEVDTVVIAGMGGETIIQILTDSPWPRTSGCTLLLQPQTKVELLRRWLSENGYACRDERLVWDKGKLYVVLQMAAGEAFTPEEARLYAGFCLENDPLYGDYLDAQLRRLRRRLEGLHRSREDADCGTLPELIAALEKKKEALS
ncbi:MAG TPA: SAM-dependent methyltransferase [Oscillibacter sp.]|nr:SAM-dependent methyltransferase [Oscillibacter sp.]